MLCDTAASVGPTQVSVVTVDMVDACGSPLHVDSGYHLSLVKSSQVKFIQPIQCQDINILKLVHTRVPIKLI